MRLIILLLLLFAGTALHAQDLTGIWRGHFRSNNRMLQLMNIDDRYKFEIQLDQRGKAFKGVTYSYKTTEFYGKAVAKGTIHTGTQKVLLEELKIVEVRMMQGNDACVMTCFLQYSRNGREEFMEGTYVSMNTRDSSDCGRGTVFLRKVISSDFYKEPFLVQREKEKKQPITPPKPQPPVVTEKETEIAKSNKKIVTPAPKVEEKEPELPQRPIEPKAPPTNQGIADKKRTDPQVIPPVLKTRENELVKTFKVRTREVIVNLYDNGTIDKDTVSVYLNKVLVVSRKMLSLSPITLRITLDDDEYHELVMVAENLGEIPPNTSLMVVKAGNQQFEVRITSTEQKNAVVRFRYEAGN
ncbi:hypothetical protein [Flavihumibacter sp.]|uniref:hypothetical protein n=1 Tax=Flavihumibacter sp. TaxID=1913981 RepID=UPI002FCB209B